MKFLNRINKIISSNNYNNKLPNNCNPINKVKKIIRIKIIIKTLKFFKNSLIKKIALIIKINMVKSNFIKIKLIIIIGKTDLRNRAIRKIS